jgi:hypothetical protein
MNSFVAHYRNCLMAVLVASLTWVGCKPPPFILCQPEGREGGRFRVACQEGCDDLFGVQRSLRWHILRIENLTTNPACNVRLTINGRWSAKVADLYGLEIKSVTTGPRGQLPAGSTVTVTVSQDVSNRLVFKDSGGNPMPPTTRFERLVIRHDKGEEAFRFR